MATYSRWPVEFFSGDGSVLTDASGRSYIDLMGGIAVASVGHCHPRVVEAIERQARTLIHVSNLYYTRPQLDLAERLSALTEGMRSFLCNSGAEAIECALKLARKWGRSQDPKKSKIVAAEAGFHGRTLGALSATGQPSKQEPFRPLVPGFVHVPFGDAAELTAVMDDEVAAVLLEPVQGEAGVIVPPDDYLAHARMLCDRFGALLILDEIQTGLGRTGAWFAYQHHGVRPDVLCLAKALGGGLPIGACLATEPVASIFGSGDHGSTFGGGPVQSAAAVATLEVIEQENLVGRAKVAGDRLMSGLERIFGDRAVVRGRGLLVGVDFGEDIARGLVEKSLGKGLLLNDATPNVIRCAPPLVITHAQIDRALGILEEVRHEI